MQPLTDSNAFSPWEPGVFSLAVYALIVAVLLAVLLVLTEFMVAVFFLLFDVEGAFIFSWAIAAEPLGWAGWLQISFFIFILLLGLAYIWVKGGLAWGPTSHKK